MSRGPGRIERAIEAEFNNHPQDSFTTDQLVLAAYPQLRSVSAIWKKHRVAVLRATRKVCPRLGWDACRMSGPGNMLLFVNRLDEMAYLRGHIRAVHRHWSAAEIAENAAAPRYDWEEKWHATWRREHEIAALQAAGDPRGDELARALAEERRAQLATLQAQFGVRR
jgi:hypothetical protein